MNRPLLVIVTGRPASGKSTLAGILARQIKCPLISRDELKEGYVNTLGVSHDRLDQSAALHIYHLFFEAIDLYVSKGISLIAEAAFQHHLWEPQLLRLRDKADIRIVICEIGADLAKKRFADRLLVDPERGRLHGDHIVRESGGLQRDTYVSVKMDVPTLVVDTTDGYDPNVPGVIAFIGKASKKKG